jgi:GST-like protein
MCGEYSIADMAAYPWIVPHERQRQDLKLFPALEAWFVRIKSRAATQKAYEIAKSINVSPTVDEKAKAILFGQDAKTVR